jgi:hypothetical protein
VFYFSNYIFLNAFISLFSAMFLPPEAAPEALHYGTAEHTFIWCVFRALN